MFLRSSLQQASFSFERIHGLGFATTPMIPAIKRLYPLKRDQVAALGRHLVFFNTTPAVCGPVIGVTAAMEGASQRRENYIDAVPWQRRFRAVNSRLFRYFRCSTHPQRRIEKGVWLPG